MKAYVILRGVIYTVLAMLAAFSGWLNDLSPDKLPNLTWVDWCVMVVGVLTAGLLALRAYIDGSAQRARDETESKKDVPNG